MSLATDLGSSSAQSLVSALGGSTGHMFTSIFATGLSYMSQVPFALQSMISYVCQQNGLSPSTYMLQGGVAFGMILAAITFRNIFFSGLVALSLVGYVGGTTTAPTPVTTTSSTVTSTLPTSGS